MGDWLRRNRLALGVASVQAALAFAIWRFGAEGPIPLHFGWNGQVDRWGDRSEAALGVAIAAAVSLAGGAGVRLLTRRRGEDARNHTATIRVLLLVTSLVSAIFVAQGFGLFPPEQIGGKAVMAVIAAVLAVTGGYLGKVTPNPLIGVRTPWTYASRLAWDKSNRLAGRLFLALGVAGLLAAPVAPQPIGVQALVAALLVSAAAAVFESWRVWRNDTDRKAAF